MSNAQAYLLIASIIALSFAILAQDARDRSIVYVFLAMLSLALVIEGATS